MFQALQGRVFPTVAANQLSWPAIEFKRTLPRATLQAFLDSLLQLSGICLGRCAIVLSYFPSFCGSTWVLVNSRLPVFVSIIPYSPTPQTPNLHRLALLFRNRRLSCVFPICLNYVRLRCSSSISLLLHAVTR